PIDSARVGYRETPASSPRKAMRTATRVVRSTARVQSRDGWTLLLSRQVVVVVDTGGPPAASSVPLESRVDGWPSRAPIPEHRDFRREGQRSDFGVAVIVPSVTCRGVTSPTAA